MAMLPLRLNTRLVLLVSCILLATGIASGWITARNQTAALMASMRADSAIMARNLAESCARYLVLQDYAELESILLKATDLPNIQRLQISEPDGAVISEVERGPEGRPQTKTMLARATPPSSRATAITTENDALIVWQPIAAGSMLGWLKVDFSLSAIREAQARTWQYTLLLALVWVCFSAGLVILVLRPSVSAIGNLTAFAKQLDARKGAQIALGRQPLEIDELGRSLNEASLRLLSTEQQLLDERKRLRESEARLEHAAKIAHMGYWDRDFVAGQITLSDEARRIFGLPLQEHYPDLAQWQARWLELMHPEDRLRTAQAVEDALRGGPGYDEEYRVIRPDGEMRFVHGHGEVTRDAAGLPRHMFGTMQDITERKQAERALHRVNRALQALSKCNEALIHAGSENALLHEICRVIVEIEGYRLAWVGYVERDAPLKITPVAQSGFEAGYLDRADSAWAHDAGANGPLGAAIRTGRIQVVQDVATEPNFEPWREHAARLGYGSVLVAPLLSESEVIGALSIHAEDAHAFDAAEIELLGELAADTAFGVVTLRARGAHEQSARRLQRSMEATIQVIASTVEMRDPHAAGHQRRVSELSVAISRALCLSDDRERGIHLAGIVHDLGRIHVPADILSKPGKLSLIEFELVKAHPEAGYDILKDVDLPWPIAQIVYQHHERLDGSGYPRGLKADQILLEARIIAVADVVEAMASHRPYRPALGVDMALEEISANAATRYDADVVRACFALFRDQGFGFTA
jgi:PAS domain S-box-containing protein